MKQNRHEAGKLKHAAGLVAEVAAGLNRNSHSCSHCGLTVLENKEEAQMAVELDAIVAKLKRFAGKI